MSDEMLPDEREVIEQRLDEIENGERKSLDEVAERLGLSRNDSKGTNDD